MEQRGATGLSSDATGGSELLSTGRGVLPERWCIVRGTRSRAVALGTFSRFVIERSGRLTSTAKVAAARSLLLRTSRANASAALSAARSPSYPLSDAPLFYLTSLCRKRDTTPDCV